MKKRVYSHFSITGILIGACVIIYVFDKFCFSSDNSVLEISIGNIIIDGTNHLGKLLGFGGGTVFLTLAYIPDAFFSGELWRGISFLFVHAFLLHIFVNMVALWLVGVPVEKLIGTTRFLFLYFVIGVSDLFLTNALPIWGNPLPVSAGASGAIFGIMGFAAVYGLFHKGYISSNFSKGAKIYLAFYGIFFSYIVGDMWTACAHTIGFLLGAICAVFYSCLGENVSVCK